MYRLMLEFEKIRATPVDRGYNAGINFGKVVADSEDPRTEDTGGGGGSTKRKMGCWFC